MHFKYMKQFNDKFPGINTAVAKSGVQLWKIDIFLEMLFKIY